VGHIYAEAASRLGYQVDPQAIHLAFQTAWERSLERRRAAEYITTDQILREEWRIIVAESFDGFLPKEAAGRAFDHLFEHFSGPEPWSLAGGARETLLTLREEGLWLGVLSNWDCRLPEILRKLGLLELFQSLVISHAVGVEKPHPEIFREAERRAGVPPESILMVGDSLSLDILPALAQGWRALWLRAAAPPAEAPPESLPGAPPMLRAVRSLGEVLERVLSERHSYLRNSKYRT